MIVAALALQVASAQPLNSAASSSDVVVVGRSLGDTEATLRDCLARRCPPGEDIAASMAHAENQFVAGDFRGARHTLTSSRGRNKRFAKTLPVPVSDLLRVDALVGSLLGERDYARIGTIDSVSALKAGLPRDDPRISAQRLLVAAVFAREGRIETAVNMCDAVAERAAEMGWRALEAEAMFRAAALYGVAATVDPMFSGEARKRLRSLETLNAPEAKPYAQAAILLRIKIAELRKDRKSLAEARAQARTLRVDQPMLIFAPVIDLTDPTGGVGGGVKPSFDNRDQWIDLRFTIAPNGRVRDVEEIARGARATGRWLNIAQDVVAGREYAPLAQPVDGPGIAQVERAVLVSEMAFDIGTHIRKPVGPPRIQFVNLTASASSSQSKQ